MNRRRFLASGCAALSLPVVGVGVGAPAGAVTARPAAGYHYGFTGYEVDATVETDVESGAPVSFDVAATGDAVDAGETVTFEVTMTNEADDRVEYHTGAPEPFGVLALRDERTGTNVTPWTDAYVESGYVSTSRSRGVGPVASIALREELDPGETVAERYALSTGTHRIRPGAYRGSVVTAVGREDSEASWRVRADLSVDVEPAGEPPSAEFRRSLSAAAINDEGFDGRVDVEVLEPVTDTHPGLVEVAFRSEWDETRSLDVYRELPFGGYVSDPVEGRRLVLQTDDMYAPGFAERDGCWRSAFVPDHFYGRFRTAVDPGETHRLRYVVFAHPEDGCPPAGTYAFTARYETGGDDDPTTEKQAADLGFALTLGEAPPGYEESMEADGSDAGATPTPTREAEATPTATTRRAAEATPTAADDPSPTPSTGGSRTGWTRTEEGAGAGSDGRPAPAPEEHPGFGVGAAVAALAGWLAARRHRHGP